MQIFNGILILYFLFLFLFMMEEYKLMNSIEQSFRTHSLELYEENAFTVGTFLKVSTF